jgi:hypothetical protein
LSVVRLVALCALLALVPAVGASADRENAGATVQFSTFANAGLRLGDVLDSGNRLLYLGENVGTIEVQTSSSSGAQPFASYVPGGEETRCIPSPSKPAYWPVGIYCHTPDNRIFRISPDGSSTTPLATLPGGGTSDGALAFDTVGRFGYALLAATGGSSSPGGEVFAIHKSGQVQPIGSYPGPGGADEIAVAPKTFGSAAGEVLITIDQDGARYGALLAISRHGVVQTVVGGLDSGLNPIAVIAASPAGGTANAPSTGWPPAGLYLPDTNSENVFFASAGSLASFVGDVFIGTEISDEFWIVEPTSTGFATVPVATNLPTTNTNFEGAAYVP